jgi:hypothetical protein
MWKRLLNFRVDVSSGFVKNKVRLTYGVVNGTLSSVVDRTIIVLSLVAGSHYYFRDFSVAANLPR